MTEKRTLIFEARTISRPCRPRRQWPDYLVTAPHRRSGVDMLEPPHGLWHARRVDALRTVCGKPAVTWHFFWMLDFEEAGSQACTACARVLEDLRRNRPSTKKVK